MKVQGWTGAPRWASRWMFLALLAVAAGGGCYTEPQENVRIVMPENGDTFVHGVDIVVFHAELATLDPTNPTGVGIRWTSSLDGVIHRDTLAFEIPAESLTVGEHAVTALVPVRDGLVEDEVRFRITAGAPAR